MTHLAKHIFTGISLTLFILSFSVVVTLNFRPLYYFDVSYFDIPEYSGYSEEKIYENYDALIDYNSFFYKGALHFPSLPMSEEGRIHFEEVKHIFIFFQMILLPISFIGSCMGIFALKKQKPSYLKIASVLSVGFPLILGGLIALNWETVFVTFHEIFFNNDYWIFDWNSDPIIRILPDGYFMHCAIMILILLILGSLICGLSYHRLSKKFERSNGRM